MGAKKKDILAKPKQYYKWEDIVKMISVGRVHISSTMWNNIVSIYTINNNSLVDIDFEYLANETLDHTCKLAFIYIVKELGKKITVHFKWKE